MPNEFERKGKKEFVAENLTVISIQQFKNEQSTSAWAEKVSGYKSCWLFDFTGLSSLDVILCVLIPTARTQLLLSFFTLSLL